MFRCEVCNVGVSSEALLQSHNQGKRHLDKVSERQELEKLAARSVFLSKFTEPVTEEQIQQALADIGQVERVLLDKQRAAFAIVEFQSDESARAVLERKHVQIGKDVLDIRPRKVDFGHPPLKGEPISLEQVVEALKASEKGFSAQIDHLIRIFGISSELMAERKSLAGQIEAYLQQFFACKISVVLFGSSSTGLGTIHADVDLSFEVDGHPSTSITASNGHGENGSAANGSAVREKDELLQMDAKGFREHQLTAAEFTQLNKSDRTRLIRKFINQYRKEDTVVGHIEAVLDNRCPVIRFLAKKSSLVCELSVANAFGGAKSNFVRDAVAAETSGTLRRFLFGLRIWAQCHGLFSDPSHPDGHWNSYLISLLAISFLQVKHGVLHLKTVDPERTMDGWNVNYAFQPFDLGKEDLANLFRSFFTYVTLSLRSENVFCLKNACIYSSDEFRKEYAEKDERVEKGFTFATVNVQDPLELSHNVGARVSKHYVTLLRKVMTFGIAQIKSDPTDFLQIIEMETKLVSKAVRAGNEKGNAIAVSTGHAEEAHAVFEALDDLFQNVLGFDNAGQPSRKRARFDQEDKSCHVCYAASFAAWQGRRPVRRTLGKQFPGLTSLELEKRVSQELRRDHSLGDKSLVFQVHAEYDSPSHLSVSFSPLEGEDQVAQDAFHFFDTFLNKYLPDYFPATDAGEKNADAMDVDA